MKLRFNPYNIFENSAGPPGLYARQKWLGQSSGKQWQQDSDDTVRKLRKGQSESGLWDNSFLTTVHRLFGLHLTVRNPDSSIDKALDCLTEIILPTAQKSGAVNLRISDDDMKGLPFAAGSPPVFATASLLFLAVIFGRENRPEMIKAYDSVCLPKISCPEDWKDICNIFRAFAVHPNYSEKQIVKDIVNRMSEIQTDEGDWGELLPFYMTVNALAHLNFAQAEPQLAKAFQKLAETQEEDGGWGTDQREWNSFLVVHALKNRGIL